MKTTLKQWATFLLALIIISTAVISCGNSTSGNTDANNGESNTTPPPVEGDGQYCINFRNWDGSILLTVMADEGELPTYTGQTPIRPDDEEFTYEFSGWSEEFKPVDGDYDYYAQFAANTLLPPWDGSVATSFEGGSGTQNDPYLIANGAQLAYLAREVSKGNTDINRPDAYFMLTQSINLGENEWPIIGTGYDLSGESGEIRDKELGIWTNIYSFSGTFDGNGKTIANLKITGTYRPYYTRFGLFGYTKNATICNLNLKNATISNIPNTWIESVGSIVGSASDGSQIINCNASATISGGFYAGSIAGTLSGSICNCTAEGNITSGGHAGGAVGEIYGDIADVSVIAQVSSNYIAGGICGVARGNIDHCTSAGKVSLNYNHDTNEYESSVGGIVGYFNNSDDVYNKFNTIYDYTISSSSSSAQIAMCTEKDTMKQSLYGGGLVGFNGCGTITQCFATGQIEMNQSQRMGGSFCYMGGLVGEQVKGSVSDCYSGGNITVQNTIVKVGGLIGSLVAGMDNTVYLNRCYSYGTISSVSDTGGLIGLASATSKNNGKIIANGCISFNSIKVTNDTSVGGICVGGLFACENSGAHAGSKLNIELINCYRPEYQCIQVTSKFSHRICNLGDVLFLEDIDRESFFTEQLGFATDIWDFSELSVANNKYPTLIQ